MAMITMSPLSAGVVLVRELVDLLSRGSHVMGDTAAATVGTAGAEFPIDEFGRKGQGAIAHTGSVGHRIGQRRRDWIDAALRYSFGVHRAYRVGGGDQKHLGAGNVGVGGDPVVAQVGI